ncbi:MAG: hypothetical protein LC679_07955, partial [Intrasporangiaceae bacterium]|nr:hypothetical protein [Intrasporangiaceae bacterium]
MAGSVGEPCRRVASTLSGHYNFCRTLFRHTLSPQPLPRDEGRLMKIIVPVKRTPDTAAEKVIGDD